MSVTKESGDKDETKIAVAEEVEEEEDLSLRLSK